MAGLNETGPALRQIEQAINLDPSYAPAWTALGAVNFIGGRRSERGAAFKKAVELAPQSVDARLALANYQWANGRHRRRRGDAEDGARDRSDQRRPRIERWRCCIVTTRRAPEAESHFRALAVDGAGKLALADYYMGVGRHAPGARGSGRAREECRRRAMSARPRGCVIASIALRDRTEG